MDQPLTAEQILTRLTSGDNAGEWGDAFAKLSAKYSRDALKAWAVAEEDTHNNRAFEPNELGDEIERVYRDAWETPGAFVEERIIEEQKEFGDTGEQAGFDKFLRMFGNHINWEQAADDPEVTDGYTLIMLDPENSRTAHAFEMDA